MARSLPTNPSLEQIKKQAKDLLKSFKSGDSEVCEILRHHYRLARATDEGILRAEVSLQEIQHALALDYGFKSWEDLKDHVESGGGEALAARVTELVEKATAVYTTKGPAHDSIGSDWWQRGREMTAEILDAGEAGYLSDLQLAQAASARVRSQAVIHFGIRADRRSKEQLLQIMKDDRAVSLRRGAMNWYACAIHPDISDGPWGGGTPANRVPDCGIDALLEMTGDRDIKVRGAAVSLVGAYFHLFPEAHRSVKNALKDSQHKVQHTAAKVLSVSCPRCGIVPPAFHSEDQSEGVRRRQAMYAQRGRALLPGEDGLKRDVTLSYANRRKDRQAAAINFALRDDPRCKAHLERLLSDEHAMVRRQAMHSYAMQIHPMRTQNKPYCIGTRADSVPAGIGKLFPCLHDSNAKNRIVAVQILGDYAGLGDARIDDALNRAESSLGVQP